MSDDTYPNAGRASGYKDDGGNDVGENIINRVTELMSAQQTKIMLLADQLNNYAAALVSQTNIQDQRFGYVLSQLDAHLKKEDARHDALSNSEQSTQAALTSAARMLDEITSYVQQSVTLSRESNDRSRRSEAIATESLSIVRVVTTELGAVKEAVIVLEEGQAESKKQWEVVHNLLSESKEDRADLRKRIDAISAIVEEHNRVTAEHAEMMRDVADLKAWRATLEARGG